MRVPKLSDDDDMIERKLKTGNGNGTEKDYMQWDQWVHHYNMTTRHAECRIIYD